jgi:mRNA-degrading endonuclease RelE of RelBE toxin-antitoxin system
MAKVIITKKLEEEINKIFKKESIKIFESMFELQQNPHKGKPVGQIGGTVIKEIRHEGYRFYFITDGYKIKMLQKEELNDLLIKFVRMSDKKDQQKVIDEIRCILKNLGEESF